MSKLSLIIFHVFLFQVCSYNSNAATKTGDLHRIINGQPCKIDDFPFLVQYLRVLEDKRMQTCGASLITYQWVLSAAHCYFTKIPATGTTIVAGTSEPHMRTRNSKGIVRKAILEIPHPDYKKDMKSIVTNDVLLSKLDKPMPTDNPKIKPVNLPPPDFTAKVTTAVVMGWGHRDPSPIAQSLVNGYPEFFQNLEPQPVSELDTLMCVEIPIVDAKECQKHYPPQFRLRPFHLCGVPTDGKDACQGDSGGPLAVQDTLVGIVSTGYGCGQKAYSIYSRVDQFYTFLESHVDEDLTIPGREGKKEPEQEQGKMPVSGTNGTNGTSSQTSGSSGRSNGWLMVALVMMIAVVLSHV